MIYLDSSAIVKLFADEPETPALRDYLEDAGAEVLASSVVAETEARRAAIRRGLNQSSASMALASMALAVLDRGVCVDAGLLPGDDLRALDALHIATALQLRVRAFVTYDTRQAQSAAVCGLNVVAPA